MHYVGILKRVLKFEGCQSLCRCYLVSLFGNEIVMVSVNTKIELYRKLQKINCMIYVNKLLILDQVVLVSICSEVNGDKMVKNYFCRMFTEKMQRRWTEEIVERW